MPLFNFQTVQLTAFISSTWNIHTKSLGYKIVLWEYNMDKFMSSVEKQSHYYRKKEFFFSFFSVWSKCSHDPVLLVSVYTRFPLGEKTLSCACIFLMFDTTLVAASWKAHKNLVLISVVAKQYLPIGYRQVLCNWVQITSHLWASAFSL